MKKETKEIKRKYKLNVKLIKKIVKWVLYIVMFILIYQLSPKLSWSIKCLGNWINELDEESISRFLGISITLIIMLIINKKGKKNGQKENKEI